MLRRSAYSEEMTQPYSDDRLDRIEANATSARADADSLLEAVRITNQSVQSLRSEISAVSASVERTNQSVQSLSAEIADGFRTSREYTDSSFGAIIEAMDQRDAQIRTEQRNTETALQNLIDDGKANTARITQLAEDQAGLMRQQSDLGTWLRASQENIQTLFTEIQRIWRQLNAA